ncbi:regulator of sirC expression with transglutaminase-like and TPR domain [Dyella japonica]|uniref:Regulator of sirC expression with transglutaminase-like and TPR domain n=1 Tax=Dyella japonica TaxID=231455 RepID=A0ABV2JPA9_9GAMM
MTFTREQLSDMFQKLDEELKRLVAEGQPEEALWETFERIVQVPASAIDHRDRTWWWEQLYSTMEQHGLTELSRGRATREFP